MEKVLLVSLSFLAVGACHRAVIEYPPVPPVTVRPSPAPEGEDFTQKILSGDRILRKRLAVARFEDNFPVADSPFGTKASVDIVGHGVSAHSETILPEDREVPVSFAAKMIDALARTKKFVLIERKDINSILREVSFGETKWVDKDDSAKVGKVLGAQLIITGALGPNDDPDTRNEGRMLLLLRMYDVETSRIVGTARTYGSTLQEVIDRGASEIVSAMDKVPWTGKVASVSQKGIYLNAGLLENIKIGDQFKLFSLGKAIMDPDTKEVIGYEEEPAGHAEVTSVSERVAMLKVLDQKRPLKAGDKVQPVAE